MNLFFDFDIQSFILTPKPIEDSAPQTSGLEELSFLSIDLAIIILIVLTILYFYFTYKWKDYKYKDDFIEEKTRINTPIDKID